MYQFMDIKKYVIRRGRSRMTIYAKTLQEAKQKWSDKTGVPLDEFYKVATEIYRT